MDEAVTLSEVRRLKVEMDEKINLLLNARGFFRSAEPIRSAEGLKEWDALQQDKKDRFEIAARGLGEPGKGLFIRGYREKPV